MCVKLPVYILSGGKSSRFGSDKARALLDGQPLISHVIAILAPIATHMAIVADIPDKYQDLELSWFPPHHAALSTQQPVRIITDLLNHIGPLGGLYTALHDAQNQGNDWLFLASCDLAGFQSEWCQILWKKRQIGNHAMAFFSSRWEPLFAFYHVSLLLPVAQQLTMRSYALWELLELANAASVPLPNNWHLATQINTPKDLERHLKKSTA